MVAYFTDAGPVSTKIPSIPSRETNGRAVQEDSVTLYPWTNKYSEYVVGFPKIYTNDFDDVSSYFGLIRCTVLPPRWLFHPVLPARCHGKLMFALCGTCMEEKRRAYCPHSDEERTIRGTWVTLEVQKAVEMGYRIGKFAQRSNLSKTVIHDDPSEVYKLLTDDTITVDNIRLINEEVVEVTYKEEGEFAKINPKTNVVIAAFTTCHARLKLYEVLEKLGDRAMYQDTDSVVFLSRPGDWEPPTGDYLGQLTDEVAPHDGNHITAFVSGGCKNYYYTTDTGKTTMKVRGITLNARNSKLVNASTLERMVKGLTLHGEGERVTVTDPRKIVRNVKTKNIESRVFKKDYRVVFDKRWISDGFDTLP
ncbi:uncharacterized protein [Amphiura filiformis]|uniref:uncharacterized protein n=1 Tax=Amphiura filiformis TaxID=82378 RepID=UPI003B220104